jgi:SAM-dependent methyltransferase
VSQPERIVPDETESGIVAIHLKRYEFAQPLCEGRDVLDAGCGVGYGAAYLAQRARRVVGVDLDAESIAYARRRYGGRENVSFEQQDVTELEFANDSFDVVCAFETIEHLADPEAFVAHAARVLRSRGALIVSTPRAEKTTTTPQNQFHTIEFSIADFEALLGRHFGDVELYGQRRRQTRRHRALQRVDVLGLRRHVPILRRAARVVSGTAAMDHVTTGELEIVKSGLDEATELVAVCRQ